MDNYVDFAVKEFLDIVSIPSPSGFTSQARAHLVKRFIELGYETSESVKGNITVKLDSNKKGKKILLAAHLDTLGAMVKSITSAGRLLPVRIGGLNWATTDGENCVVHTRDGKKYGATVLNNEPSTHVSGNKTEIKEENMQIVLDDYVSTKKEVQKLGIENGCYITIDPKAVVADSGLIKSRFLDDKISVSILLSLAKYLKDKNIVLDDEVYLGFTVHEEVGHGAASGLPSDVEEIISVDMGCVGADLDCTIKEVSICAKDSSGPYDYDINSKFVELAKKNNIGYAVDIYPYYASDASAAMSAGFDAKHACIGPGVYASHNYEQTHKEAVKNTLELLIAYIS